MYAGPEDSLQAVGEEAGEAGGEFVEESFAGHGGVHGVV